MFARIPDAFWTHSGRIPHLAKKGHGTHVCLAAACTDASRARFGRILHVCPRRALHTFQTCLVRVQMRANVILELNCTV